MDSVDPLGMLKPARKITGISPVLLSFRPSGEVDWGSFEGHLARTLDADLMPAVNTDVGCVSLISPTIREEVLINARAALGSRPFVAGAYVADERGQGLNEDAYFHEVEQIQKLGGTPLILQSNGLTALDRERLVATYRRIGDRCERFLGFEFAASFAPYGRIYDLETWAELMHIPACVGIEHASGSRKLEWERITLRDAHRPEFMILSSNTGALDMVMYGSDHIVPASTLNPGLFALRDAMWEARDPDFHELNDLLQKLSNCVFRGPLPAYRHSIAQFLKLRGMISSSTPHPRSIRRPEDDVQRFAGFVEEMLVWEC